MSNSYVTKIGRKHSLLLPDMIEDYIDENNPARLFDSFVNSLTERKMKSMSQKAINAKALDSTLQSKCVKQL